MHTAACRDVLAREGGLADKSNQLILDALSRAASEPFGAPLFATKKQRGLFPGNASSRPAADRCQELGLLLQTAPQTNGTPPAFTISAKGLDFLLTEISPRRVLEELTHSLQEKDAQIHELAQAAERWSQTLAPLRDMVERLKEDLNKKGDPQSIAIVNSAWLAEGLASLAGWQDQHAARDCPLPDHYRLVQAGFPGLTIGGYHDGLRRLHEQQKIYLHPWTGPLYDLPEPAYALLIGHEIAYYVSRR